MSVWQAILQGMIQGLTEFLPVSSSGHLSIFQYFTGLSGGNPVRSDPRLLPHHLGTDL